MDFELKKSGQIPVFGNWDGANEMPITQYFESARQAGLVRYSASGGDSDKCHMNTYLNNNTNYGCGHVVNYGGGDGGGSFYAAVDYGGMPHPRGVYGPGPPSRKVRTMNRRHHEVEKKRIVMKVRDMMNVDDHYKSQQQNPKKVKSRQQFLNNQNNSSKNLTEHVEEQRPTTTIVNSVDEDLYKIPPNLLHKSERKKRLGFFSRCLVPPCST